MKVLVQKNIWQEYSYDRFLESMNKCGIEYKEVNIIPFTKTFSEPVYFTPDYIFGSTRFVYVCRNLGYPTFPGFDARPGFYPKELYINDGETMRWGDVKIDSPKFVKPLYAEKFFTGRIFENQEDLEEVQLTTSFIDNESDVLVIVSNPVNIIEEYRFFCIGGKISTASLYKIRGENKRIRIDRTHNSWKFLEKITNKYGYIEDGFVIDIGLLSSGEYKIVELNCIHSSGLYDIDTDILCKDLMNYYHKQSKKL